MTRTHDLRVRITRMAGKTDKPIAGAVGAI